MSFLFGLVIVYYISLVLSDDSTENIKIDCTNESTNFKYKVIEDGDGPLVIFGDINDSESAVFCLRFESIFEVKSFDNQDTCDIDDKNSNTEIQLKDQTFNFTNENNCTAFSFETTTEEGVTISFNFMVENSTNEPGFKYTFELENYIFNKENEEYNNGSLVIQLKPEKCDDIYDIDSESIDNDDDSNVNDTRRMLIRRMQDSNSNSDSDSTDRNEIGVSSDDSNDFDLNTLIFRNTPNATVNCGNEDGNQVISVQMCYDNDNNDLLIIFDQFGNNNGEECTVIQDPYTLIDTNKYSTNTVENPTSNAFGIKGFYFINIFFVLCASFLFL